MRKNFLLLFLMTLLPLAGWAQTAVFGDVAVGIYTYGDESLPTPVVKDKQTAILTEGTHYEVSTSAYDKSTDEEVALEDVEAGQELYLVITGINAYVGQTAKAYFTVQKKKLTVTVATTFEREYGSDTEPEIDDEDVTVATLAWDDTKADLGTLAYTYAGYEDATYAAGDYAITFSGFSSDNYDIVYPEQDFTIYGKNLSGETVTIKDGTAFADKTYKGAAYTADDLTGLVLVYDETELTLGTDFEIEVGDGDWTNVGAPYYTVNFINNYDGTKANFGSFNITKAPLSVDVASIDVTYNSAAFTDQASIEEAGGTVTLKYYGFVGDDVADKSTLIEAFTAPSVAVTQDGGATNVGSYALTVSGGATNNGNYEFVDYLNTGKLVIAAKEVELAAKDAEKGPADDDPAFELEEATFAGEDYIDESTVTFTREEGNTVGESYEITPVLTNAKIYNSDDEDVTSNYTLTAADEKGVLTITQTTLTITILDQEKEYGEADPETIATPVEGENYIVTGLVSGDAVTVTLTNSWSDAETVGNYVLNAEVSGYDADNYSTVTVVPGNFAITKAPLTVTLPIQTLEVGAEAEDLSTDGIVIEGFKYEETAEDTYTLAFVSGVSTSTNKTYAEGYVLTLIDDIYANYDIDGAQTINGKLIIGTGDGGELELVDDEYAASTIATYAAEPKLVKITFTNRNTGQTLGSVERHWMAGQWNTMVLPFDIDVAGISKALGYAIVNVIDPAKTVIDGKGSKFYGKLTMKGGYDNDDVIPANHPFLVKIADDLADKYVFRFGEHTIVAPNSVDDLTVDAGGDVKFIGTYDNKEVTCEDEAKIWFMLGDQSGWARIGESSEATWTIYPFSAYLDLSAIPFETQSITFYAEELDGSVTAIKSISTNNSSANQNAEGWYNLNGVKMQGVPTQKGVYINNGKKVVIK